MSNKTKCPLCSRSFARSGAYENHINSVHKGLVHLFEAYHEASVKQSRDDTSPHNPFSNFEPAYLVEPGEDQYPPEPCTRAGAAIAECELYNVTKETKWSPWIPFRSAEDYWLARFFVLSKTSKSMIDKYFHDRLHPAPELLSFTSGHTFFEMVKRMRLPGPRQLGQSSWRTFSVSYQSRGTKDVWMRNPLHCIEYLLAQRTFAPHLKWGPIHERDNSGNPVYRDLYNGDWWSNQQVRG